VSEPDQLPEPRARIIASGRYKHVVVTREAVEGAAEQLAGHAVPVHIEHDPTRPPVGRMLDPCLVELEDGELALEATMEIRAKESVPAIFRAVPDFKRTEAGLTAIAPESGELELDVDERSYSAEDLDALRAIAARAGDAAGTANAARFSELPDALLTIGLGTSAVATFWFARGFFTNLGEQAAKSVGPDLAEAYQSFKAKLREVLSRRNPAETPPLTVMRLEIERQDGALIDVEGSSRADDEAIYDFLDAGEDLLTVARVYAKLMPEPERLRKLHFERVDGVWILRYGLDDDAKPVLAVALSEEEFEKLAERARREQTVSTSDTDTASTRPHSG